MLSVMLDAQQRRMNALGPPGEKIAAAAVAAAGDTHPAMAENDDEIGRVSRQLDREIVMRIEFPFVTTDTTVMSVVEAGAVLEGMIVTGTESGIVIVIRIEIDIGAELLTGKGIDYEIDDGHQNETGTIDIGTAAEKETVNGTVIVKGNGNENGNETEIDMIIVAGVVITLARVHDPGTGTVTAARIETGPEIEKGTVIVSVSVSETEVETMAGNEVGTGGRNHGPALLLEDDLDPGLAPTPTHVAPPASSTSTDTSPQRAVAVDHLVDGYDHRISERKDLTVMTDPGLGRLIDTFPGAAARDHHEIKNENAAANEDEVLVGVDDRSCMFVYMLWDDLSVHYHVPIVSWLGLVYDKRVCYKIILMMNACITWPGN